MFFNINIKSLGKTVVLTTLVLILFTGHLFAQNLERPDFRLEIIQKGIDQESIGLNKLKHTFYFNIWQLENGEYKTVIDTNLFNDFKFEAKSTRINGRSKEDKGKVEKSKNPQQDGFYGKAIFENHKLFPEEEKEKGYTYEFSVTATRGNTKYKSEQTAWIQTRFFLEKEKRKSWVINRIQTAYGGTDERPSDLITKVIFWSLGMVAISGIFYFIISFFPKHTEKALFWLNNIITIAPMFGFLGTLWGLSKAFYYLPIALATGQNSTSEFLGPEINLALFTTVFGLTISIIFSFASWFAIYIKNNE